jgi:twitching motility protein PilT
VETSGYQPVPNEPGGFTAMPVPVPEPEAPADQGWNFSFDADQPVAEPPVVEAPGYGDLAPYGEATVPAYDPLGPSVVAATFEAQPAGFESPAAPTVDSTGFDSTGFDATGTTSVYDLAPAPVAPVVPPVFMPEQLPAAAPVSPAPPPAALRPNTDQSADAGVLVAESEADEAAYSRGTTEAGVDEDDISLNDLLMHVLDTGASDLHLTSGARPSVRLNGELKQMEAEPILTPPVIQRVMYAALTQKQREKFEENLELDFAYSVPGRARFRVNLYRQRDALGAAFRIIPFEIRKLEDLGVPPSVANFASLPRGFVLVTGPTGSGKSTTLASLVDLANRTRSEHIMTVEDPIEFLHRHQKCIVNQREVGEDTWSFQNALKHVLRQDPDIILVGEMRDLETISVALTAAETGHLVFATLHTQDAAQTIDRIIDVFPTNQQQQVRVQLAGALQGIVCQTLAKTRDGRGRAVATEVLVATPAIRNLIREGKTHQIYSAMQAGAKHGMHTMDQHLADLVMKGRITYETGLEKCHHVEDFNRLSGRG